MPESVKLRTNHIPDTLTGAELYRLLAQIQADLAALNTRLNTHVHSGVTTGASNSGAPTTTGTIGTQP